MTCPDLVLIFCLGAALAEPPENSPALWEERALRREAAGDLLGAESALRHRWRLAPAGEPKMVALANLLSFLVRMGRIGEAGRLAPEPRHGTRFEQARDSGIRFGAQLPWPLLPAGRRLRWSGRLASPGLCFRHSHWSHSRIPRRDRQQLCGMPPRPATDNRISSLTGTDSCQPGLTPGKRLSSPGQSSRALTRAGRREAARHALTEVFAEVSSLSLPLDDHVRLHQLASILLRRLGNRREARLHVKKKVWLHWLQGFHPFPCLFNKLDHLL